MVTHPHPPATPAVADLREPAVRGSTARIPARPAPSPAVMCISSEALLAGAMEVQIEHRGALYRLKQTSLGKLILTK